MYQFYKLKKLIMKNSIFFIVFISFFGFLSCSETIVTRQEAGELETPTAPAIAGLFKKRVLIEDYTGTWCGNCTGVLYAIEKVHENPNDASVVVAIHSGNDPFKYLDFAPLQNYIFNGGSAILPEVRLNRTTQWIDPDTNILKPINLRSSNCGVGLAIKSTLTNNNISLDILAKFAQNYSGLKLVVYIVENKLIYKQTNYTNYFNAVNPIQNFEHNHVMRKSLTNVLGDNITEITKDGTTLNKNFLFAVPANIANTSNIGFVAFIVDQNNTAINVRGANINENQLFEENF